MKKSKNRGASEKAPLTIFERAMNLQAEMFEVCKVRVPLGLKPPVDSPTWKKNIFLKLRNTIFQSFLKLRPSRKKVNWRNYGRTIGCLERYKAFLSEDLPRIMKELGLDKITDEQWKQIWPELGVEKARENCLKYLNRPADDPIPDEELFELALERQLEHHEKLKQIAYGHLAAQDAKTTALFLKGVHEGYSTFLNVDGHFSGDDRRFSIYCELLVMEEEIKKMRRMIPPKNNQHLIGELRKSSEFRSKTDDWFKEVFKDIKLSIGQRGRPAKFAGA